ncbi:MAG: cobalamin-binding protein [Gemmatimonadetes bacterium]|nr:MAG: cobalamin-binding protein [Gemmatimonadota bacterium]
MERARRIVSLLPSATEIVCALGLEDRLVGVSHSCDYPPHVRTNPVLTRPRFPLDGLSSGEIDAAVRQALREFGSVYEVDGAGLAAARPDLLLTQGVCEVCAVPTRDAQAAAAGIATCPSVLALDAHDIAGVLHTIRAVGHVTQVSERADACVRDIERRIACVRARVEGRTPVSVLALEWLDPPFVPGHWVPEMVALAGGRLLRGTAGRRSFALSWEEIAGLDPDVVLVMPCGFDLAAAGADADRHAASLRAAAPRAIGAGRAYAVDATAHFSRPGPRIADGVELLAGLLHPEAFPGVSLEGRARPLGG